MANFVHEVLTAVFYSGDILLEFSCKGEQLMNQIPQIPQMPEIPQILQMP